MQKILNYIYRGQGLGCKFIFLASVILALFLALYVRIAGADLVPYTNDVINQMLPLKVQNGVVVEPQNTIRVAQLNTEEFSIPLPIVLNTTIDQLDTAHADNGLYLTRTAFYILDENEVRMYPLNEDFELYPADYQKDITSALSWTALGIFFFGIILIFISYFIAAIFYALCAQILGLIFSKKYNFDIRMRLSVVCFAIVYIFYFLLSMSGWESGRLIFLVTTLALQAYTIYKLPYSEETIAQAIGVVQDIITQEENAAEEQAQKEPVKKTKAPAKRKSSNKSSTTKKSVSKKKEVSDKKKSIVKKTSAKKGTKKVAKN